MLRYFKVFLPKRQRPTPSEVAQFITFTILSEKKTYFGLPEYYIDAVGGKLPAPARIVFDNSVVLYLSWSFMRLLGEKYGDAFRIDAAALSHSHILRARNKVSNVLEMADYIRLNFQAMDNAENSDEPKDPNTGLTVPLVLRVASNLIVLFQARDAIEFGVELAISFEEVLEKAFPSFEIIIEKLISAG